MVKPKLLLLHGALGSKDQFEKLSAKLCSYFEIYAFNFYGHGGEIIEKDFSIEGFAKQLEKFIQVNQLSGISVFGYSMGGYIALQLASQNDGCFSKIMTLGTKFDWNESSAANESKMLNPTIIQEKVPKFAEQLKNRHQPEDWKKVLKYTSNMMIRLGKSNGVLSNLKFISCPVLIALGEKDSMVSKEESIVISNQLINSEFLIFENDQHPIEKVNLDNLSNQIKNFFS